MPTFHTSILRLNSFMASAINLMAEGVSKLSIKRESVSFLTEISFFQRNDSEPGRNCILLTPFTMASQSAINVLNFWSMALAWFNEPAEYSMPIKLFNTQEKNTYYENICSLIRKCTELTNCIRLYGTYLRNILTAGRAFVILLVDALPETLQLLKYFLKILTFSHRLLNASDLELKNEELIADIP